MEFLFRKAVFVALLTLCCGCSFWPRALHPSQLWKMNRQDAWDEGSFSIPDPVDPRLMDAVSTGAFSQPENGADRH